jgi:hypothetical protein
MPVKVYGPYYQNEKTRRFVQLIYADGRRKSTANARWIMEQHLGRYLTEMETVDHRDGDSLNDTIENLQVMSLADNIRKSAPDAEMIDIICPECGVTVKKLARQVRHNQDVLGKPGPYCGKRCAGRVNARRRYALA